MKVSNMRYKSKIQCKRDTEIFSRDDYILDYIDVDWDSELDKKK